VFEVLPDRVLEFRLPSEDHLGPLRLIRTPENPPTHVLRLDHENPELRIPIASAADYEVSSTGVERPSGKG
jgi:hypothetical protein